ncbi:MAG: hypothetical protein PHQ91_06470 [Thermoanaerobaculaceae bacterium]|nr:hypothetical protein [Thermoanaerobaculaceae bacterium]
MTTVRRSGAWLVAALALTGAAATAVAQEAPQEGPAPRLVVFEAFTRYT